MLFSQIVYKTCTAHTCRKLETRTSEQSKYMPKSCQNRKIRNEIHIFLPLVLPSILYIPPTTLYLIFV